MKSNKLLLLLLLLIVLLLVCFSLAAVVSQQREDIPNRVTPTNKNRQDLEDVANELKYYDIFRKKQGTIHRGKNVRVDKQGFFIRYDQTWYNLQGQLNGLNPPSTIAHVLVSESANTGQEKEVTDIVIAAMIDSCKTGKTYNVSNDGKRNGL
ncbi:hypothetical protein ACTA71_011115 [Dictyostelium dimigraforme]